MRIRSKDIALKSFYVERFGEKAFRYRKNYKKLPGKPDIAITKYRIAVFCDSRNFSWQRQDQLREAFEIRKRRVLDK